MRKLLLACLLLCLCISLSCAVASDDGGAIPITTKSEKARELFKQGRDLQEKLRVAEAKSYIQQAVAEDPDFAMGHLMLALTSTSAKDFFDELEKAKTLAPSVSAGERLWIEGFAAGVNGDSQTQKDRFTKLVAAYPKSVRSHNLLGGYYFGQQEWQAAIDAYEKSLAIDADYSQPYNQLGYAYRFLGKYDMAEKAFKKYIELIPDDPNPYDSYAELLMKIGKFDESIAQYQKALQVNPKFVNPHFGIASDNNFKGNFAGAREQLQKLYDNAADDGQRRGALFAKTVSYVHEGNLDKALEAQQQMYDIAAKINDHSAMAGDLATMGFLLVQFGKPDAAAEKFTASLKMTMDSDLEQPQKDLAQQFHHFNLSQVAIAKKDFDAARKEAAAFKAAAEMKKNANQIRLAHELSGRIALAETKYDAAIAELKQANLQNPQNLQRLGWAYEGKGDAAQANDYLAKAKNFNAFNNLNQAMVAHHSASTMTSK